ncbi:uncharacterized protein A4U43_C10F10720 [Asparagus officinalis]|uniref:alpha-galactosidase n=1 Tax=Asparagus officinalis TaxID=4686 RepID=A0A5P1E1W5_ASPOF|nr:uncharacterized protein A4U43_C10F10720 [Asparagus officinalis]
MTKETVEILTNKEVIAVNQDPLGVQAKKVRMEGDLEIWAGPLSGYRTAVVLLNRAKMGEPTTIIANWDDLAIPPNMLMEARDLWKHETLKEPIQDKLNVNVGPHSCRMFILTPILPVA